MKRWIAIRASGVLAIVGSAFTLLVAVFMAIVVTVAPMRDAGPLPPLALRVLGVVLGLLFASASVWGIATGIGIFRRRRWARISMAAFACLLLFFGGTGVLTTLFLRFPVEAGIDTRATGAAREILIGFYSLMGSIGAWWAVLFTRAAAKEYFTGGDAAKSARPLSIGAIGWYLLAGAVFAAIAAVARLPFFLFGWMSTGWTAMVVCSLYAAVQVYLATGLLALDERARVGSLLFFGVATANGLAMVALPDFTGRMLALQTAWHSFFGNIRMPVMPVQWLMAVPTLIFGVLPVWFLVTRRAAFTRR